MIPNISNGVASMTTADLIARWKAEAAKLESNMERLPANECARRWDRATELKRCAADLSAIAETSSPRSIFAKLFPDGIDQGKIPKHGLSADLLRGVLAGDDPSLLRDALILSLYWAAIYQDRAERFAKELATPPPDETPAPDLDALEAKARAATAGEWITGGLWPSVSVIVCVDPGCGGAGDCPEPPAFEPVAMFHLASDYEKPPPAQAQADAAFVAAANPQTILALIARLRAAEGKP